MGSFYEMASKHSGGYLHLVTTVSPIPQLGLLLVFQVSLGWVQRGFKDPNHPSRQDPTLPTLALKEGMKILISLLLLWRQNGAGVQQHELGDLPLRRSRHNDEELLFNADRLHGSGAEEGGVRTENNRSVEGWPRRQLYPLIALALLYVAQYTLDASLIRYADARTIRVVRLMLIFVTAGQMQLVLGECIPSVRWTSATLQFAAMVLQELFTKFKSYSGATYALLFSSTWLTSIVLISTSHLYQSNREVSTHKMNLTLFTLVFGAQLVGLVIGSLFSSSTGVGSVSILAAIPNRSSFASTIIVLLRAIVDIVSISVLRETSPLIFCAVSLLSTALIPPISYLMWNATDGFGAVKWAAVALAIYAASSYLTNQAPLSPPNSLAPSSTKPKSSLLSLIKTQPLAATVILTLFLPLAFVFMTSPLPPRQRQKPHVWNNASILANPPLPPHKLLPAQLSTECVRRPLPSSSAYVGSGPRPDFHAFDDVLLIAFFSHPRYDVNMDGYREAYSRYFPNILFIGPATREDGGFLHSYDAVLDSFQWEEDFSEWYKLAGSMAQHMMYTAIKDYPCYSGYLWAPFDAFLNIPRLMQFPQDQIWYHSPFGQYIPNFAWPKGDNLHPNSAQVSKKTPEKYLEEATAWGGNPISDENWWFGEPHVGLEVCMEAYRKVPQRMRDRLQNLTGGPERFIGGSVDTMFIPGHLREDLLDTLATFLETSCFLEIVLPTTLHMIVPERAHIAYTDHWWMNDPPFDTSFIRQKWADGYEVDSFHSFHWGDVHADGLWRANENSVEDVNSILQDSFRRQGMVMP